MFCMLKQIAYICMSNDTTTQIYKIILIMKAVYNKSKIMRNAWYMFRVKMVKSFAEALRKAWKNEKLANIRAMIEGRALDVSGPITTREHNVAASMAFVAGCLDYYANARTGQYFGD